MYDSDLHSDAASKTDYGPIVSIPKMIVSRELFRNN
jgi:hypothetical protein